jgi:hypothetical protein
MGRFAKKFRKQAKARTIPHSIFNKTPRTYGRVNAYTCQRCGEVTWTVDVDDGVTPFMITCRTGCRLGDAHSAFYRVPADHPEPTHEWYRPDEEAGLRMDERHWKNGGLFLREIAHGIE